MIIILTILLFSFHSNSIAPTKAKFIDFDLSTHDSTQSISPHQNPQYENILTINDHAWEVRKVIFSPDESMMASGSSDGSIRIWDSDTFELIHLLQGHHYDVISLVFSQDHSILVSGGFDMKLNFWNVSSGSLIDTWSLSPQVPYDIAFTPSGDLIVALGFWSTSKPTDNLQIFRMTDGTVIRTLSGHNDTIGSLSYSPDGSRIVSTSFDGSVILWDVANNYSSTIIKDFTLSALSAEFSPNNELIVSGGSNNLLSIYNITSNSILAEIETDSSIWSITFLHNTSFAVAIGETNDFPRPNAYWQYYEEAQDSTIKIFDLNTMDIILSLQGHNHIINSIAYSKNHDVIVSGSWDWTVKIWGKHDPVESTINEDNWMTGLPEDVDLNTTVMETLTTSLGSDVHSFLVVKGGKLVWEKYFSDQNHNYTINSKHVMYSATKSVTSALIGIAIDKGFIESVDQHILDFFLEYNFSNMNDAKKQLTIRDVITMRSGITWGEGYSTDDLGQMAYSLDSVQYVLDKTVNSPGSKFSYNTGGSQLLSAIITQATGMSSFDFAVQYLFSPLGMDDNDIVWMRDTRGDAFGGIGLFLTPRNMAKFGTLFLNNGSWNGVQLISNDWIEQSTSPQVYGLTGQGSSQYGSHWWIYPGYGYFADGYNGKLIFVFPKYDTVVVITAERRAEGLISLARDVVLDAIIHPELNSSSKGKSIFDLQIIYASLICLIICLRVKKQLR